MKTRSSRDIDVGVRSSWRRKTFLGTLVLYREGELGINANIWSAVLHRPTDGRTCI